MIVWTRGYRPFIMGGDVNGPVGTDIEVGEKIDLGKGYYGYLVASPISGTTYIAESTTGAFVGPSIAQVRLDIAEAPLEIMQGQVENAQKEKKRVSLMTTERFWEMLARGESVGQPSTPRDDRTALEVQAYKDFAHVKGKILCVDHFTANVSHETREFDCCAGVVLVRVMETDDDNITHWCDDWLDPEWDIEVVAVYDMELPDDISAPYMNGTSYNVKDGDTKPAAAWYPARGKRILEGEFYGG